VITRRSSKLATKGKDKLVSPNVVPAIELYPKNHAREGFIEYTGTVIRRAEFNKTKEPRVLAMSESVRAVIERRWQARTVRTGIGPKVCELVFHREGSPICDFRGAWEKACIAAGLCVTVKDAGT
jgi:hypothetical protein